MISMVGRLQNQTGSLRDTSKMVGRFIMIDNIVVDKKRKFLFQVFL